MRYVGYNINPLLNHPHIRRNQRYRGILFQLGDLFPHGSPALFFGSQTVQQIKARHWRDDPRGLQDHGESSRQVDASRAQTYVMKGDILSTAEAFGADKRLIKILREESELIYFDVVGARTRLLKPVQGVRKLLPNV